jgi:hypothetical protein
VAPPGNQAANGEDEVQPEHQEKPAYSPKPGTIQHQPKFFHTFEFERGTYDGGVIEISNGGDFEDLGPKILKGGYTGTIYEFTSNPLIGRSAWIEGRLGTFQEVVVDLSSVAGQTMTIRFRIGTDQDGKGLGWYIDDVSLRGDRITCTLSGQE